jgi:hypothetical protein
MDLLTMELRRNKKHWRSRFWILVGCYFITQTGFCQSKDDDNESPNFLPKANIQNLTYIGGFRLPLTESGESRIAYSEGTFTLATDRNSFFIVGHAHHQAIAEFSLPKITKTNDLDKMSMAKIIQPFSKVLTRSKTGNKDELNSITGLEYIQGQMWLNAVERYDANANARATSLVIRDASNLKSTNIDGYYSLKGRAHAAGWVSAIPPEWQKSLGAEYITGYASNPSINSRLSIGPTAFTFYPFSILDSETKTGFIPTEALMDFSLKTPLNADRYNDSRKNNIWTEVSAAVYGFIIPGTQTYFVIGRSGGHKSGIGYKATQDNGNLCSGPCSKKHKDNYNYYWMWSVNDLEQVRQEQRLPHEPKPYEYGYFDKARKSWRIIGADYDKESGYVYVLYESKDRKQSKYEAAPLMLVYKVNI